MYIKKIELQNFQIIKDFSASFEGGVYLITGDNELGKSTLLKAIGALLTGERDAVLRNGEKKGFARMVVGDDGEEFEVGLSFTEANPRGTLTIKQKSTGIKSDNLSMLQRLLGYQDFDAVEFIRWSETADGRRRQVAVIKSLLPAEVRERIENLEARISMTRETRLQQGREVTALEGFAKTIGEQLKPEDLERYKEPVELRDIMARQEAAVKAQERAKTISTLMAQRRQELAGTEAETADAEGYKARRIEAAENALKVAQQAYEDARARLEREREDAEADYQRELDKIAAKKADLENRIKNAEEWLAAYKEREKEYQDTDRVFAEAEAHNKKFHLVEQFREKKAQFDNAVAALQKTEAELTALIAERRQAVETAPLPVSGLSFNEDGLALAGVPFVPGKVSDSQAMEVATKLVIAANPKVKVFRIARGESLGGKRLADIVTFARQNGYQGFIENVVRGQEEMRVEEYTEGE